MIPHWLPAVDLALFLQHQALVSADRQFHHPHIRAHTKQGDHHLTALLTLRRVTRCPWNCLAERGVRVILERSARTGHASAAIITRKTRVTSARRHAFTSR